jgi:predicted CXXCH cytochrome family protein
MLAVFAVIFAFWMFSATFSSVGRISAAEEPSLAEPTPVPMQEDFVGSETCRGCHETQFDKVANTKHGKLHGISSWKDKVVGCEACHGPGKAHVEGGGDVTKIRNFKNLNAKEASETCLTCHAGKEGHNNFRRGDHWRNNVGCTECHSGHGSEAGNEKPGSITFVGDMSRQRPNRGDTAMLKSSEPSLCISCHNETKSQFSKPFHHKVLEGAMSCSDCHNPHGGFEQKQTKLAVGADASCIKCHANKQGPFVYEHAPLKLEGCASCHTPHGSANPKMLKRAQVRQMCFECHTGITDEVSPQAPSLHNQAVVRYQQCTVCHSAIHGSNSSRFFFR